MGTSHTNGHLTPLPLDGLGILPATKGNRAMKTSTRCIHELDYGCASCSHSYLPGKGWDGALPSGAYGVSGEPSSGYPDHDERPAGSLIDPTYTSRITWDGDVPVVSGPRPSEAVSHPVAPAIALNDSQWTAPGPTSRPSRAKLMGPRVWLLTHLDFDALAYLEAVAAGRQQWRPDPALQQGWTLDTGIEDAWPGETTIPPVSARPGDQGRSWIGYRSQGRQHTLVS